MPVARRTAQDFIDAVQLGHALAARLPADDATRIRETLRDLGVSVFLVKSVRAQMRCDTARLDVEASKPFELIFENPAIRPHHRVIVTPGARGEIGHATMTLGTTPDTAGPPDVPKREKILAAPKMLEPGQEKNSASPRPPPRGSTNSPAPSPATGGSWDAPSSSRPTSTTTCSPTPPRPPDPRPRCPPATTTPRR